MALKHQKPGGCNYGNELSEFRGSRLRRLTCRELWKWLAEHGIREGKLRAQMIADTVFMIFFFSFFYSFLLDSGSTSYKFLNNLLYICQTDTVPQPWVLSSISSPHSFSPFPTASPLPSTFSVSV